MAWHPWVASAQGRFELSGQGVVLRLAEFDMTDVGAGVQVGGALTPAIALDGALAWFPNGDSLSSGLLPAQQRFLGVAGVRAGLHRGRLGVFGKARPGFLRFAQQESAVCIAIAIFPVPLGCLLATGYTAFVVDVGGGVDFDLGSSGRSYVRVEAGDLMIRYDLEAFRPRGGITDGFTGHNFNVAAGIGWRFR
jgi:hypothetical protein